MIRLLGIILCLLWLNPLLGQYSPPSIQWQKPLGGTKDDWGEDIQFTADGGFIIAGTIASNDIDGNLNVFYGQRDAFVVKLGPTKELEWRKKYGGSDSDYAVKIIPLRAGGYIVLGKTRSPNNGVVSGVHGNPFVSVPAEIWVLRLDNDGNLLWQKCLGGTGVDLPGSIDITPSGGFIVSGSTASNDGDVTGNHGNTDAWVVELSATGNILWQKCYGGSGREGPAYIKALAGGGYIFTAYTESNNGDVTANNPKDIWLVRIDATGNIIWQKCFGGTATETPYDLLPLADGFVVAGSSNSSDWSIDNNGSNDGWVVKTDLAGNLLWQTTQGGSGNDWIRSITPSADGGFLMAGGSAMLVPGCYNNGEIDYWVLKTENTGKLMWQKNYGGTKVDFAAAVREASDKTLYVIGSELSDDRDVIGHRNSSNPQRNPQEDIWILQLGFSGVNMTASVKITSSLETICEGSPVEFKAHPVNGGSSPTFFWYVNGIEQPDYDDTFVTTTLQDGDKVTCKMLSQQPCIVDQEVMSNEIIIHWYPNGRASGFLPLEITKCINIYETLKPDRPFDSYLWSTGATTPSIRIVEPGLYWLEVTDQTGCSGRENVWIKTKSCMNAVFVPAAFTPNNDGLNDIFKPLVDGHLTQYKFVVYNRNGQIVFQTTDPSKGWNGTDRGYSYNTGVFVWICTYQLAGEPVKTEKGTVTLIR